MPRFLPGFLTFSGTSQLFDAFQGDISAYSPDGSPMGTSVQKPDRSTKRLQWRGYLHSANLVRRVTIGSRHSLRSTPDQSVYHIDQRVQGSNNNKILYRELPLGFSQHTSHVCITMIFINHIWSWTIHINNLSKQIARNVGMLNKFKYFLPLYTMKTLYYSLILPHLQYCVLLWLNTYTIHLKINKYTT